MTLVEFLLARIEEDQVKRATMREWHTDDCDAMPQFGSDYTYPCDCGVPERMARECEAKQRIIELHVPIDGTEHAIDVGLASCADDLHTYPCPTLRALALPYVDHRDYRPEWRDTP